MVLFDVANVLGVMSQDTDDEESRDKVSNIGSINSFRLKNMIEDIRPIVEKEAEWLMESETDFMRIFRFNMIVLGAYVSILSLSLNLLASTEDSVATISVQAISRNLPLISSVVFWSISTLIAVLTFGGLRAQFGPEDLFISEDAKTDYGEDSDKIHKINNYHDTPLANIKVSSNKYYRLILERYIRANSINHREASLRYRLYTVVLLLLVISVTLFILGLWTTIIAESRLTELLLIIILAFGGVLSVCGLYESVKNIIDKYRE